MLIQVNKGCAEKFSARPTSTECWGGANDVGGSRPIIFQHPVSTVFFILFFLKSISCLLRLRKKNYFFFSYLSENKVTFFRRPRKQETGLALSRIFIRQMKRLCEERFTTRRRRSLCRKKFYFRLFQISFRFSSERMKRENPGNSRKCVVL